MVDLAQFGRDTAHNGVEIPRIVGLAIMRHSFTDLRDLVTSGELSQDELAKVEHELAILDDSFPRPDYAMKNYALGFSISFLDDQVLKSSALNTPSPVTSWRYGFSLRLMVADASEKMDNWMRRMVACESAPWTTVLAVRDEVTQEYEVCENDVVQMMVGGFFSPSSKIRIERVHLRLVRAAAHYLATGEMLELDDPFGKKLGQTRGDRGLKMWSVGTDGVDNGGEGEWSAFTGPDIVLEIERKDK